MMQEPLGPLSCHGCVTGILMLRNATSRGLTRRLDPDLHSSTFVNEFNLPGFLRHRQLLEPQ